MPQFADKAGLTAALIQDVFMVIHSGLFPEHEGAKWVLSPDYEHPKILTLHQEIERIEQEAEQQKKAIRNQVEAERCRLAFLHGMLTSTGDKLVENIVEALRYVGFQDVVDVDKTLSADANKAEDVWVRDKTPTLLIEAKGLGSKPTEGNTQQLTKFLNRRKSEWKTPDIHGVFLVNHQLGVQPLQRDNQNVFTEAQVKDARLDGVGLMTTWDLFRLIRGMEAWSWPQTAVQDVFYRAGRIGLLPAHWKLIGRVVHFYDKASVVSVELSGSQPLNRGDTVGFAFSSSFEQQKIESMQVEKERVETAHPGQRVGFKTAFPRGRLTEGLAVYVVETGLLPKNTHAEGVDD